MNLGQSTDLFQHYAKIAADVRQAEVDAWSAGKGHHPDCGLSGHGCYCGFLAPGATRAEAC